MNGWCLIRLKQAALFQSEDKGPDQTGMEEQENSSLSSSSETEDTDEDDELDSEMDDVQPINSSVRKRFYFCITRGCFWFALVVWLTLQWTRQIHTHEWTCRGNYSTSINFIPIVNVEVISWLMRAD